MRERHYDGSSMSPAFRSRIARTVLLAGVTLACASCPRDSAREAAELTRHAAELSAQHRTAEAVAAWKQVVAVADGFEPRIALAEELRALGRTVESADQLRSALKLAPVPVQSWYELGQHADREGRDPRAAARYYRQSVELAERGADGHYALGLALLRANDFEGASAEIQAALSLAPVDITWRRDAEDALVVAHLRQRERERAQPAR